MSFAAVPASMRPALVDVACAGLLTGFVLLVACAPVDAPASGFVVADSAGVTIVTNHDAAWAAGGAWTVDAVPERTIGVVEGEEVYQFSEIGAAARQTDGDIVVADARTGAVRLYGPDGSWKKTIGRAGSAPGEFRAPRALVIGAADSILVWDEAAWRLTRFDADGELAAVEALNPIALSEAVAPPLYAGSARPLHDGSLLVRLVEKAAIGAKAAIAKGKPAGVPAPGDRFRAASGALLVSPDRQHVEVIAHFADDEQITVDAPWGLTTLTPPLARTTAVAAQADGSRVCIGDQAVAEVRCIVPGQLPVHIRWSREPVPVTDRDEAVTQWRETTLESWSLKIRREDARRVIDLVPAPLEHPLFRSLFLDSAGHLWVGPGRGRTDAPARNAFLVFAPTGRMLGTVDVPAVRVLEIGEDVLLGVREDALGVQILEVYRIDRSTPGDQR